MKLIVDVLERGEKKVTGEEALKIIPKGVVYWVKYGAVKHKDSKFAAQLYVESLEPIHHRTGDTLEVIFSRYAGKSIIPEDGKGENDGFL